MSPLCPECRRYTERGATWCSACGRGLSQAAPPLEIVLADGTRVALVDALTIGRAPRNDIRFTDPSVSRLHARILAPRPQLGPVLADAGSAHGTWLDGKRLQGPATLYDGATIRVGDSRMEVERHRDDAEAGRTIVVRAGMSVVLGIVGDAETSGPAQAPSGTKPRVRDGLALKRMEAAEGDRWILRDPAGAAILRLGEPERQLLALIDGRRSLGELVAEAESRGGPAGPAVLAHLLADLGEHGFLSGIEGGRAGAPHGRLRGLLTPRVFCWPGAGDIFERVYRRGGFGLFTRRGLFTLVAIAVAGLIAFAVAIAGDYATPFVVADHVGLGGLVFILGRLLVVLVHELAHALTMIAFGRPVQRSGVKFILGFPYAFVDTTAALFEPRRRRLAVSASGPLADLVVGGACALTCVATTSVTTREVSLQIALSAYTGALFNLNPLLDRDGYHMLVDWLRTPSLRRHAREWLAAGGERRHGTQAVVVYALATIAWSLLTAGVVIFLSLRYQQRLLAVAPDGLVWVLLASLWGLVLLPAAIGLVRPLRVRARGKQATS